MSKPTDLPGMGPGLGETEFRELADNAPVLIWRAGTDKQCDWFNKPWLDFTGKTQDQLCGYGWGDDVHPDDLEMCTRNYEQAFDARESFTTPYRLRRHDGSYRWFLDHGAPFYRLGVFAGYFGSCTDITAQKELEAHQDVLVSELNHRVKNNLQLIIAFLQMSKLRAQGDEARQLLESAIARIQGVGTVQAELYRSASGTVDLAHYLPHLVRASIQAERDDSIHLTVDTETAHAPFKLASDLGLIVNELVANAIHHGNQRTTHIHFALKRLGTGDLQLTVSDRGPGFSPAQLSNAGASGSKLSGQGLIGALARRCGAVLNRSNAEGAVVTLTLPHP
ncbi:sensor histidine kinase [Pseudomonas sp. CFBP 13710]|uniref:sensor histidine kinase n=1 Tax=Pseudomonas sp. CFBP 13710 TaxID=2775311 RepID=UPI00177BABE8|nr:histidine kinase dimerization/phosphoacceptor domain -containing protein [Pseudomonas sp. CFBP 13710]MBD8730414.1 PAS domain S-box protein [Pseudomonas sp. CFBP 13710]